MEARAEEREQQDYEYLLALSEDARRRELKAQLQAEERRFLAAEARLQAEKADLEQVRAKRLAALKPKGC